jgi:hypothetical protein
MEAFKKPMSTPEDCARQFELAREYLECVARHPVAHGSMVRRHLFFMLFDSLQANLDIYDVLYTANSQERWGYVVDVLENRARAGKSGRKADAICAATGKPRATRRDGTVAPPPWPVGGGGLNVNQTKVSVVAESDDEFEVIGRGGKKLKSGRGDEKPKKKKKVVENGSGMKRREIDTSKMDLSRFD